MSPATKYFQDVYQNKTPFYLYDSGIIESQYTKLRNALPENFEILYAVKANPHQQVMSCLRDLGTGADIASGGELTLALCAGFAPEMISFAGPGKTEDEIVNAVKHSCAALNIESIDELILVEACAKKVGLRANACVRINPKITKQRGGIHMGGHVTQFGIAEENIGDFFSCLNTCKHVDFRGIHVFVGSQILEASVIVENFRSTLACAQKIQSEFGRDISVINFGGGFGIPYFEHEKELDLEILKRGVELCMEEQASFLNGVRLLVESGRFIVGPAGIYVTRVLYKKVMRGKTFVITDGGINHHATAGGQFSSSLKRNYDMKILNKFDQPTVEKVTIAGPLCTPLDILARDITLPEVERGDYIGIFNSGAYAYTISPLQFLSHQSPGEYFI